MSFISGFTSLRFLPDSIWLGMVLLAIAAPALLAAQWQIVEDFDTLNPASIDSQHLLYDGVAPVYAWSAQSDSSWRSDHGLSQVISDGENQYLRLRNFSDDSVVVNAYTSLHLAEDQAIIDRGSIYLRFKANGFNDFLLAGNDLLGGYLPGDQAGNLEYQGLENSAQMGFICCLSGGQFFRIYDGSSYQMVAVNINPDSWYELLIHLDCAAATSRFTLREMATQQEIALANPATGQLDWPWRNQYHTNTAVRNLKWFQNFSAGLPCELFIDKIMIDAENISGWPQAPNSTPAGDVNSDSAVDAADIDVISYMIAASAYDSSCDLDGDGSVTASDKDMLVGDILTSSYGDANLDLSVDLDDFIILKQCYGLSGVGWQSGDFNGDGRVDLNDFIILKQNYGR